MRIRSKRKEDESEGGRQWGRSERFGEYKSRSEEEVGGKERSMGWDKTGGETRGGDVSPLQPKPLLSISLDYTRLLLNIHDLIQHSTAWVFNSLHLQISLQLGVFAARGTNTQDSHRRLHTTKNIILDGIQRTSNVTGMVRRSHWS